jgi:hypothetical protein
VSSSGAWLVFDAHHNKLLVRDQWSWLLGVELKPRISSGFHIYTPRRVFLARTKVPKSHDHCANVHVRRRCATLYGLYGRFEALVLVCQIAKVEEPKHAGRTKSGLRTAVDLCQYELQVIYVVIVPVTSD